MVFKFLFSTDKLYVKIELCKEKIAFYNNEHENEWLSPPNIPFLLYDMILLLLGNLFIIKDSVKLSFIV